MIAQRLSELNASLLRARAQRVSKEAAFHQIEQAQNDGRPLHDLAAHVATPVVQQLSIDLAAQERREAELSATYGEKHPSGSSRERRSPSRRSGWMSRSRAPSTPCGAMCSRRDRTKRAW